MKKTSLTVLFLLLCMSFHSYSQNTDIVTKKITSRGNRWLKGKVTYTDSTPVVGARILMDNALLEGIQYSITGENGEYSFNNLNAAVETAITIETKEKATYQFKYINTNQGRDFVLTRANRYLSGLVVDENGNPLKDFGVSILPKKTPSGLGYLSWSTNDQGRFKREGIAGEKVTVEIQAPEWIGIYAKYKIFENIETNKDHTFILGAKDRVVWPLPVPQSEKAIKENDMRLKGTLTKLINTKAPEMSVDKWINTGPIRIGELKGKTVILHFWSTKNEDSSNKAKFISILKEEYANRGVVFISIHDFMTVSGPLLKYIKDNRLAQNIAIDQKSSYQNSYGKCFDLYGVARISHPDYISIDKDGNVSDFYRDDELEKAIIELISSK